MFLAVAVLISAPRPIENRHPALLRSADQLHSIVGEWQSDTTSGISARSSCGWSPQHGGVLCEQRITTPGSSSRALDLFVPDTTNGAFVLYVVSHPGSELAPVPFTIRGHEWVYGGTKADPDGVYYRTVNDFSNIDSYDWRQETSKNGKDWTVGIHGHVRLIK